MSFCRIENVQNVNMRVLYCSRGNIAFQQPVTWLGSQYVFFCNSLKLNRNADYYSIHCLKVGFSLY